MVLREGMTGEAVRALQRDLIALGYDLGASGADGVFGARTTRAVIAFQKARGLTADGVVGAKTSRALARARAEKEGRLPVPHGLAQIRAAFGDPLPSMGPDPQAACYLQVERAWARQSLGMLQISGLPAVRRLYCHRKLHPILTAVFAEIVAADLADEIKTCGCFCPRYKRRTQRNFPSTHCWGIALDINQATNHQGTPGDMPAGLIAIFRRHGFRWGGDWPGQSRDPMHFQYCTGY